MSTYLLFHLTEKKENIIRVALRLFAKNGYVNTSTSKIAKVAGVSEGLIFRHFGNKQGLLDAIVDLGLKDAETFVLQLTKIQDPKEVLSVALELPKYLVGQQQEFWQMHQSLKYQSPDLAEKYKSNDLFLKLTNVLEKAFKELKYEHSKQEAALFLLVIGGLFSYMVNDRSEEHENMVNFVKSKYRL